ncbi:FMN-linked oxidoreductase [Viridothelium virens]|uniref:FMN-linked oxidoreductase n=1 Tax=Viridothelium virens TaxID=1048519 RepID=A0A6A6HA27_VIRVR|nr:FMN-linked oxidoreductase [Viridothelium virens]
MTTLAECVRPSLPRIEPPILNSACPWATTFEDLLLLLRCPYTGAITTRTCTLEGFSHNPSIHQFAFFNPQENGTLARKNDSYHADHSQTGSLNTLGYSPIPLSEYLHMIQKLTQHHKPVDNSEQHLPLNKPIIVSVTGSPSDVAKAWQAITDRANELPAKLCMEINLSCPNIPGAPPPAYDAATLYDYLEGLNEAIENYSALSAEAAKRACSVPIGIKCPPYTYLGQFNSVISALLKSCGTVRHTSDSDGQSDLPCPVSFITTTNTLGSSLIMDQTTGSADYSPTLVSADSEGIGGMGGTPIHPLSLGNVRTLRLLLDKQPKLSSIDIIGVGGVSDAAGLARMKAAGAKAVAVATALGREGIDVFEKICTPLAVS